MEKEKIENVLKENGVKSEKEFYEKRLAWKCPLVSDFNEDEKELIKKLLCDGVISKDSYINTCSLSGLQYYGYGNNAYPFEGTCCDNANTMYVLPARFAMLTPNDIKRIGKRNIKDTLAMMYVSKTMA